MKTSRRRIDVSLDELDRVLEGARQAPLSQDEYEKLKEALHALAAMLVRRRNTEKTSAVLGTSENSEASPGTQAESNASAPPGHGRNEVGDLFMSLIHTCQLCGANSFDYLIELQRHAQELATSPAEWMPWNYQEVLAQTDTRACG